MTKLMIDFLPIKTLEHTPVDSGEFSYEARDRSKLVNIKIQLDESFSKSGKEKLNLMIDDSTIVSSSRVNSRFGEAFFCY